MPGPLKPAIQPVYKRVTGLEITTDIYFPDSNFTSQACPVLINIHGGAFMLGASSMVNKDQIQDCLERGWIVIVPNHRLCPQVTLLEGPMQDCRDLLAWIYDGSLERVIRSSPDEKIRGFRIDETKVMGFGTSSGGHLALSLGWGVKKTVAAIYDMYGATNFENPAWTKPIPHIAKMLPPNLDKHFLENVYHENPVPTKAGVSLEGQATPPDFSVPRQAFAFQNIAAGTVLDVLWPSKDWALVDPLLNITNSFPPTFIVHGTADTSIPIELSRTLLAKLKFEGVECGMREIQGQEHTFAAKMTKGSETWIQQREGFDFLEKVIGRNA